jgi:hypothetical protein
MQGTAVYHDESVYVARVELKQRGACPWHVHHRKCDGLLVYCGVLMIVADNLTPQYLRADTGAVMISAGMPHRWIAMSDVKALMAYRAKTDEALDPADSQEISARELSQPHTAWLSRICERSSPRRQKCRFPTPSI